ncbi:uncharacterized protein LOC115223611 [Octopus sinensis]|uniref:Uncharacterized protein LOC115223611 n=1 Tax=Octopus sinensis TaxID=2607531 RepID=A0A6P7TK89_9MOLL|nr:uncharacterized protein LOC115223611 [Octopus sinensis]
MNHSTYLLFLLLTFVTNTQATFDPKVCKPDTTNIDDSFPKLHPQYSVFIEANYISNKSTVHFTEYHDANEGANVIKRSQQDSKTDIYLFENTGEMFIVTPDGACKTTDLWKNPNKYLFGEEISNGRFFSLAGAVELAETNFFKVKEKTTVIDRGMSTSVWSACQYLPSMKATVKTTWYFATEDSVPVTPVRLHMKGKDGDGKDLEYQFEFFHYKPYILTEEPIFETPRGTVCNGRKQTKPLPNFPDVFSCTTEIVNEAKNSIQYQEEEYDTINQLVRFTYKPVLDSEDSFGTGKLTKIHDYKIDVAYIIDDIRGNCTMQPIFGNDDDIRGDHNQRMATAKEIFKVDKGIFTYEGVQSIRGYECDLWVAHIDAYPAFPLMTGSIIEWYFTTRQWSYGKAVHGVPKLMTQTDLSSHEVEEKNIYNFRETEPDILLFDVTACFEFRDKYKFTFTVPAKHTQLIERHLKSFKRGIVYAIIDNIEISPMRINQINVEFEKDKILASFEIHDKVTVPNSGTLTKKQISLKKAVDGLRSIFDKGAFTVPFKYGDQQIIMIDADSNSLIMEEVKGTHKSNN